jgi:hypothetical protein
MPILKWPERAASTRTCANLCQARVFTSIACGVSKGKVMDVVVAVGQ